MNTTWSDEEGRGNVFVLFSTGVFFETREFFVFITLFFFCLRYLAVYYVDDVNYDSRIVFVRPHEDDFLFQKSIDALSSSSSDHRCTGVA